MLYRPRNPVRLVLLLLQARLDPPDLQVLHSVPLLLLAPRDPPVPLRFP